MCLFGVSGEQDLKGPRKQTDAPTESCNTFFLRPPPFSLRAKCHYAGYTLYAVCNKANEGEAERARDKEKESEP